MRRNVPLLFVSLALAAGGGCRGPREAQRAPAEHDASWAVTAWGERYEVFAETDGLVAGQAALSNPHVTVLADFSPLRTGTVTIVLRAPSGQEQAFRTDKAKRDGIFPVEIKPASEGEFDLLFRVQSPTGEEEIPAGRVRVGAAGKPGGSLHDPPEAAPDSVSFLKEQQWRTPFATAWVEEGSVHDSVSGPARVRPVAGGEAVLTAPADATVASEPWPHVGLALAQGSPLFRLIPRVGDRSLPEVQADAAGLAAEVEAARKRAERLDELLKVEATSPAEVERSRAALTVLEARLAAARQGLHGAATQDGSAHSVEIVAPWDGRVAEVSVSPGQTVAVGAPLGRIVRTRPLWLEVALRPEDAARLRSERLSVSLRRASETEPLGLPASSARLVSRAPEVDPRTASLAVILELDATATELPIGSSVEADLLLPAERKGIVVPVSSLVQDAAVSVVYVQLEGETFTRREVRVLARQGGVALVEGLRQRERLVTTGGGAVRRSSLLSSGAPEGHVH
jgi:membrane fusion protein, heavy metal efflux system